MHKFKGLTQGHTAAYAEFSKEVARKFRKFEINEDQNQSVLLPKLGENQNKKKGLHSNLVRFLAENWVKAKKKVFVHRLVAQTFCQSNKGGGGACRNFVYYSMLILRSWRPKGGAMAQCSPLNTPLRTQQRIASSRIKPIVSN